MFHVVSLKTRFSIDGFFRFEKGKEPVARKETRGYNPITTERVSNLLSTGEMGGQKSGVQ